MTADFNHDGLLDIATGNETSGTTTILSNTTHLDPGAFAFDPVTLGGKAIDCGSGSDRLVAADFNSNGIVDLATTVDCGKTLSVFLDGKTERLTTVGGWGGYLHAADLNRDGKPDLVMTVSTSPSTTSFDVVVYLGDGLGNFTRVTAAAGMAPYPGELDIADVNRDGIVDAVVLVSDYSALTSRLQVLLGRGDGTFSTSASIALPSLTLSFLLSDANGDGKTDALVLASGGRGTDTMFRGDGLGGFALDYDFRITGDRAMTGDVNEDGVTDVLISTFDKVHVFAGLKGGGFASDVVHSGFTAQALADMDGDGHLDLVGQADYESIAFGRGDGLWDPPAYFDSGYENLLLVADYNRDGLPDVLFTQYSGYTAMINTRRTVNQPPTVDAGADLQLPYDFAYTSEDGYALWANGKDPDAHALSYEWRNEQGETVSRDQELDLATMPHGPHRFTVTASDGRGGSATDDIVITIVPAKEIVLHMWEALPQGTWQYQDDSTAADGTSIHDPNRGAPKAAQPLASPTSMAEISFFADPTQTYKLWIRGKAENDSWANDSAFIQFTGAVDPSGNSAWQIGSTSALVFNLEECSGCGVSGWGWEDDGWGAVNKNGVLLRFPQGGYQRIRIQTREDGLSIDQIVLSAEKYLTTRPGPAKNDKTILPRTQ